MRAQLRNLFTLHEGVACQTHDLTGCRCHCGEVPLDDEDGSGDEDGSDEDEMEGFMQASQFHDDDAVRKVRRAALRALSCHSAAPSLTSSTRRCPSSAATSRF